MKYFIKNIKNLKIYIVLLLLLCILKTGVSLTTAQSMAELTSHFTNKEFVGVILGVWVVLGLYFAEVVIGALYHWVCGKLGDETNKGVQEISFTKVMKLSVDSPFIKNQGDLYNRVSNDASQTTEFLYQTFPSVLMQTVQIFMITVYILIVNWKISTVYLASLIIAIILQGIFSRSVEKINQQMKEREVNLNTYLKDAVSNRLVVKTYESDEAINEVCQKAGEEYYKADLARMYRSVPIQQIGFLCGVLPTLTLCMAGFIFIPKRIVTLSAFMAVFYLCQRILFEQLHYVDLFLDFQKVAPAFRRMQELWEAPDERKSAVMREKGEISLENVTYSYLETEYPTIENLFLKIPSGKKVAFVGKSGSGKSTVLKIISGLLTPQKGKIRIPKSILVDQFPDFFTGTVRENICCFGKEKSDDLYQACKLSGMNKFLTNVEQGLDKYLKNNGESLSGGQRQRMAIARALYAKTNVLLLDEAVSALDGETAREVVQGILKEYEKSTIIMVLHQKEFLPYMDEIYVFEDGKILDHGSYKELMKKNLLGGDRV